MSKSLTVSGQCAYKWECRNSTEDARRWLGLPGKPRGAIISFIGAHGAGIVPSQTDAQRITSIALHTLGWMVVVAAGLAWKDVAYETGKEMGKGNIGLGGAFVGINVIAYAYEDGYAMVTILEETFDSLFHPSARAVGISPAKRTALILASLGLAFIQSGPGMWVGYKHGGNLWWLSFLDRFIPTYSIQKTIEQTMVGNLSLLPWRYFAVKRELNLLRKNLLSYFDRFLYLLANTTHVSQKNPDDTRLLQLLELLYVHERCFYGTSLSDVTFEGGIEFLEQLIEVVDGRATECPRPCAMKRYTHRVAQGVGIALGAAITHLFAKVGYNALDELSGNQSFSWIGGCVVGGMLGNYFLRRATECTTALHDFGWAVFGCRYIPTIQASINPVSNVLLKSCAFGITALSTWVIHKVCTLTYNEAELRVMGIPASLGATFVTSAAANRLMNAANSWWITKSGCTVIRSFLPRIGGIC